MIPPRVIAVLRPSETVFANDVITVGCLVRNLRGGYVLQAITTDFSSFFNPSFLLNLSTSVRL